MNIKNIPAGKDIKAGMVNVLVEIPKNGDIKYEIDYESGALFVDRFLYTSMSYPFNYGMVPGTLGDDGDAVDVLVLSEKIVEPGCVIPSQIIGMLEMEDEEGMDPKFLAVPTKKVDPFYGEYQDITDVPEAIKNKVKHFFENYKTLEPGKWIKLHNWLNKEKALEELQKDIVKHNDK